MIGCGDVPGGREFFCSVDQNKRLKDLYDLQTPVDFYLSCDIIQIEASDEAKSSKSGGILVSGVKGKSGGAREGTRPIIKRFPDFCKSKINVSEVVTWHVLGLGDIGKCSSCGAVWWGSYILIARGGEVSNPDDEYPIIYREEVSGQPEKHKRGCPNS